MSWNEQDPWKRKQDGPPNIDNIIRNFFSQKTGKSDDGDGGPIGSNSLITFIVILALLYIFSGFYVVKQPENAVVTRFGKLHQVQSSGLKWHPRVIDKVRLVNLDEILSFKKESQMLTNDENIVYIGVAIQYRRSDPVKFLFADQDPHMTIENIAESSIRQAIGLYKLEPILTVGKAEINEFIRKDIQLTLNNYDIGLELQDVNLITVVPPSAVMEFFNDVTKAREDKFSTINDAEKYRDSEIPIFQGKAEKIRAGARAYREEKILEAQGESSRFELILKEYRTQPEVFKKKLYFDTLNSVLTKTTKILLDESSSQQLLYLPLDQMILNNHMGEHEDETSLSDSLAKYNNVDEQHDKSALRKDHMKKINLAAPAFRQ